MYYFASYLTIIVKQIEKKCNFIITILFVFFLQHANSQSYTVQSYTAFSDMKCFLDTGDSIWIGTGGGIAIYQVVSYFIIIPGNSYQLHLHPGFLLCIQ